MNYIYSFILVLVVQVVAIQDAKCFFEGSKVFATVSYMNENLTRTTSQDSGKKSFLGSASSIPVFVGLTFPNETDKSMWAPQIGYTFLPREDKDGAIKVEYLILSLHKISPVYMSETFDYTFGTSYVRQTQVGQGGTISSSNGGSAATFYAGDYNQTAQYMTVDFGLGYNFAPYKVGTDLYVLSPLSEKRSYNLLLNFTYFWGL